VIADDVVVNVPVTEIVGQDDVEFGKRIVAYAINVNDGFANFSQLGTRQS
jgi:hypothetical protein